MFWLFLLFSGLALVFVKLGALSVTAQLLSLALNAVLVIAALMGIILLWRIIRSKI